MSRRGFRRLGVCTVVAVAAVATPAGVQDRPPQQQQPVFRAGTHFVRVDAYPTRDGEIIPNLSAGDFELLEDGRPQRIDSVQFVRFDELNPLAERRDPNSVRDMYRQAADPANRVFVLYFDTYHVELESWRHAAPAARHMVERMLGPRDLFGVLTPQQNAGDLTLGQIVPAFDAPLLRLFSHGREIDPVEVQLEACQAASAIRRYRLDRVFTGLEGLVVVLNAMREERKNIILFSDGWTLGGASPGVAGSRGLPSIPRIVVSPRGTLTTGATHPYELTGKWCDEMVGYLSGIDFSRRWRDLMLVARQKNVAFYPVSPGGVWTYNLMSGPTESLLTLASETDGVPVLHTNDLATGLRRVTDDLSAYYLLGYYTSNETWDGRVRQITVRLRETGEQVRARRQYRAPTDEEMAMSRAALDAVPAVARDLTPLDLARAELARLGSGAVAFVRASAAGDGAAVAVELASGQASTDRWRRGAAVEVEAVNAAGSSVASATGAIDAGLRGTLVVLPAIAAAGPVTLKVRVTDGRGTAIEQVETAFAPDAWPPRPAIFRATPSPRSPLWPAAELIFRRTERLHLEWGVAPATTVDAVSLVGPSGDPIDVPVTIATSERNGRTVVTADVLLASLSAGDYAVVAAFADTTRVEQSAIAVRIVR